MNGSLYPLVMKGGNGKLLINRGFKGKSIYK